MFESFGFEETTARQASAILGLGLGILFGLLGERTRFCLRRALVMGPDRASAQGVWLAALATAMLGTQAAVAAGWISFGDHRFLSPDVPLLAIVAGGLLFGAGMVLTRGCISRLTVLTGTGNLRALLVLVVLGVITHATMKGVLAPLRTALGSVTVELGSYTALSGWPGGPWLWTGLLAIAALTVALRSRSGAPALAGGLLIGLLVPLGWIGTGFILFDDFDPIALESLSFTAPWADSLFYTIAATSIPVGFGVGLVGGVILGALAASLAFGSFRWQSFASPRQTGRYMGGAALMGIGGVLAGGCTIGAGLSGLPTLGVSAFIALGSIAAGAMATDTALTRSSGVSGGSSTRQAALPAE